MTRAVALSDEDFARLRLLLARLAGLAFDESRRESLAYSLSERLRATGLGSVAEYLDLVQAPGSPERQALLDEVTVQETHFFRNPPQVRALRAHVLPELLRAAGSTRRLRIWSAGCSTGEEPYTIAMVLRELLPVMDGWDIRIIATDISERALEAAREGVYGWRAVQLASPEELGRFFVQREDGRYAVRPEVRELVSFQRHNLVEEPPPLGPDALDLVLCRNVTIYFSRDTTRALMHRLHGALRDGGYLFLGHAETLWHVNDEFRLVALGSGESAAFVYRRLDARPDEEDRRHVLPDRRTLDEGPPDGLERRSGPRRAWAAITRPRQPVAQQAPRPRSARDLLSRARAAVAEGRYADAVDLARAVVDEEPLRAEGHRLHGEALVALRRDDEALVALRKAVYLEPGDDMAHFGLAGVLARTGSARAAAREYRAAAAGLSRRPAGLPAPELGGRSAGELVALCLRLAGELESAVDASRAGEGVA